MSAVHKSIVKSIRAHIKFVIAAIIIHAFCAYCNVMDFLAEGKKNCIWGAVTFPDVSQCVELQEPTKEYISVI